MQTLVLAPVSAFSRLSIDELAELVSNGPNMPALDALDALDYRLKALAHHQGSLYGSSEPDGCRIRHALSRLCAGESHVWWQYRNAETLRWLFPYVRDHLRRFEDEMFAGAEDFPFGDWHWLVGAFVQCLAIESDDALAAALDAWLQDRYQWGLEWVRPPYVSPRRQAAISALEAKALIARLKGEEQGVLSEIPLRQSDVSTEFMRGLRDLLAEFDIQDLGSERQKILRGVKEAGRPVTEHERDCLRRMWQHLSARLHMEGGDKSRMD